MCERAIGKIYPHINTSWAINPNSVCKVFNTSLYLDIWHILSSIVMLYPCYIYFLHFFRSLPVFTKAAKKTRHIPLTENLLAINLILILCILSENGASEKALFKATFPEQLSLQGCNNNMLSNKWSLPCTVTTPVTGSLLISQVHIHDEKKTESRKWKSSRLHHKTAAALHF